MTRIEKFWTGIRKNPAVTLLKAVRYSATYIASLLEIALFHFFRFLILPLPARAKIHLKYSIQPQILLDYPRDIIFIHADSPRSILRARACEKEPETVQWIEESMQPDEVLYDVGANVGAYSLVASKYLQGRAKIYAFEPSFSTYDQLCRNVILNRCQHSIYPFMIALNNSTGMLQFDYNSLEAGASSHTLATDVEDATTVFQPVY